MKRLVTIMLMASAIMAASAQTKEEKPWKYVDAQELRIINKGWTDTERDYTRLPASLRDSVSPELWDRGECSAGIGIRFATNSSRIGIRYALLWNTHMIHMADTGLKGTDLYILQGDSIWMHVNTNRPYLADKENKIVESTYVSNLDTTVMSQYMVYLPLYDGVNKIEVKVDSNAVIDAGNPEIIDAGTKIVAYGTSILQGGCASRTGMASTNIIGRRLNCEVVNLGFSGQGKMDYCMARAMAAIEDADLFLLDPIPNCTEAMCDSLTYDFVNIIRKARPDVPIVMLEGPIYPYARYDSYFGNYLPRKNEAFRRNYERLIAENPENLYYVTSENLDGIEDDGTVDGIHLTDLGFLHYADKLTPILEQILRQKKTAAQ